MEKNSRLHSASEISASEEAQKRKDEQLEKVKKERLLRKIANGAMRVAERLKKWADKRDGGISQDMGGADVSSDVNVRTVSKKEGGGLTDQDRANVLKSVNDYFKRGDASQDEMSAASKRVQDVINGEQDYFSRITSELEGVSEDELGAVSKRVRDVFNEVDGRKSSDWRSGAEFARALDRFGDDYKSVTELSGELKGSLFSGGRNYFSKISSELGLKSSDRRGNPEEFKAKIAAAMKRSLGRDGAPFLASRGIMTSGERRALSDEATITLYDDILGDVLKKYSSTFDSLADTEKMKLTLADAIALKNSSGVDSEPKPTEKKVPESVKSDVASGEEDSSDGEVDAKVEEKIIVRRRPPVSPNPAERIMGWAIGVRARKAESPNPADVKNDQDLSAEAESAAEKTLVKIDNAEVRKQIELQIGELGAEKAKLESDMSGISAEMLNVANLDSISEEDREKKQEELADKFRNVALNIGRLSSKISKLEKSMVADKEAMALLEAPEMRKHVELSEGSVVTSDEYAKIKDQVREAVVADLKDYDSLIFMKERGLKDEDVEKMSIEELHKLVDDYRKEKLGDLDKRGISHERVTQAAKIIGFGEVAYADLTAPQVSRIYKALLSLEDSKKARAGVAPEQVVNAASTNNEAFATSEDDVDAVARPVPASSSVSA